MPHVGATYSPCKFFMRHVGANSFALYIRLLNRGESVAPTWRIKNLQGEYVAPTWGIKYFHSLN